MTAYTNAQLREMRALADRAKDVVFDTVFFGGGTPTLLPVSCMEALLKQAKAMFNIEQDAEITMEANPASANAEKLCRIREIGVNRLSVGVQSLIDTELAAIGRVHSADDALSFLTEARRAGFDNLNVDLMYGIPTQTVESVHRTFDILADFSPEHISAYSLILEEGTPLFEKRDSLPFPTEEEEDEIDHLVKETLKKHGYIHYEISNYAQAGRESRHNLHYWHSDPYLGFGVAAYSFFENVRYGNHTDLSAYIADPTSAISAREVLNDEDLAYEWIMLRLRLAEGLSIAEYKRRFGVDLMQTHGDTIATFKNEGLMKTENGRIALTERGFRLSNSILISFMPDEKNS